MLRHRGAASLVAVLAVVIAGSVGPPPAALGQAPGSGSVPRMGVIHHGGVYDQMIDGLRQGLRELGLEEGKHLVLDVRDTRG
jgi:hypothetical protein